MATDLETMEARGATICYGGGKHGMDINLGQGA